MLLSLLLAGVSLAADPHADSLTAGPDARARAPEDADAAPAEAGAVRGKERGAKRITYEIALRGRFMTVPTGVLDLWYTREKDELWPLPPDPSWKFPTDRPVIQGVNYGLEVAFRDRGTGGGLIFFDWVDSQMTEGYWDDRDEDATADDFKDGDYIVPASNIGLIMFGGDYQYELPLIKNEATAQKFQLHFTAGAGLGLAILVGRLDRYKPGANDEAAYALYAAGEDPNSEKEVPRVWPVVDVNLGFKFLFAQRFTLRLEGGLHTLLYGGAAVGYRF